MQLAIHLFSYTLGLGSTVNSAMVENKMVRELRYDHDVYSWWCTNAVRSIEIRNFCLCEEKPYIQGYDGCLYMTVPLGIKASLITVTMPLLIKYPSDSLEASWTSSTLIICKSSIPFRIFRYLPQ